MTAVAKLAVGQLDPATLRFVEALVEQGGKPIYRMSVSEAREVLENLQSQPVEKPQAGIQDLTIPCGPSGQVSIRIVRPANATGALPAIMYFHGGGWILGSKNTHDRLVREIANSANAAVVFVDYTRSPEAQFPVAIEEAYAATNYVSEHPGEMNLNGALAIAGDSAGGNMTAAVAILAEQRGGPEIALQALFYPVTDASFNTPSYKQFAGGPWLAKLGMEWFWDAYAPDSDMRKQITACPLRASIEDLVGLPPALILTAENDVLRDEGEAYAHKLIAAGVEVTAVRFLGTIHDSMMLNPLAGTPATRSAIRLACDSLRRALSFDQTRPRARSERGYM